MKKMLQWKVYIQKPSAGRITTYNIFEHTDFLKDCKEVLLKHENVTDEFRKELAYALRKHFWSKAAFEIVVTAWPPETKNFKEKRVSAYDQVNLNFDLFVDYVWKHRKKLMK